MANYKNSLITRNKMIATASELFFENGYMEVSGRKICEKSEVSLSRLKYYFDTKADLAIIIFRDFLKLAIGKLRDSKLTETEDDADVSLIFYTLCIILFIDILTEESKIGKFSTEIFYDMSGAIVCSEIAYEAYTNINMEYNVGYSDTELRAYSKIFANALGANIKKYTGKEDSIDVKRSFYINIYASLFMKIMDIPKQTQTKVIKKAIDISNETSLNIISFNDVAVI